MNDIIVTSVTHGGSGDGARSENVVAAFAKVDVEYKPQKAGRLARRRHPLQVRPQGAARKA